MHSIALNLTKFGLYLPSSDSFSTKWNSFWCQINRKNGKYNLIQVGLTRFGKDFSVYTAMADKTLRYAISNFFFIQKISPKKRNTFKSVIPILMRWRILTDIVSKRAISIIVKIPLIMCQFVEIAATALNTLVLGKNSSRGRG